MKPRSAFTLVELLVVISILAVLIAILLPSLKRAREQSKEVVCRAHLKDIGQGMWLYWSDYDDRLPYVISPMTNGTGTIPGFGREIWTDAQLNPFDRELWPFSLPNQMMPRYLGEALDTWTCPAAINGWPRRSEPYTYTYRPASANQPNGQVNPEGTYLRENFGFLDGRKFRRIKVQFTGDIATDVQLRGRKRSMYIRDLLRRQDGQLIGPHRGGINVLNRNLEPEYRSPEDVQADLNPAFGSGAQF